MNSTSDRPFVKVFSSMVAKFFGEIRLVPTVAFNVSPRGIFLGSQFARRAAAIALSSLFVWHLARATGAEDAAFRDNVALGRGMNLGNALEAAKEGEWGVTLQSEYFREIKRAGFNSVRVPIRWSAHAAAQPPYTIDASFFERIDWVVDQALSNGLVVVLDMHHYFQMFNDPDQNAPRLIRLWAEIAAHYRDRPDRVFFELLNEPQGRLTDEKWQTAMLELLRVVRASNPTRTIIVGPAYWNSLDHFDNLGLPENDRHIIVTFHYYTPMRFTHQGASWVAGSDKWKGTTWTGSPEERAVLEHDFDKAAAWSEQKHRPLNIGEFGALQTADMDSRAAWTRAVVDEAQKHEFSWAYWEFCSAFGAYDPVRMEWRKPLLDALTKHARSVSH